MNGSWTNHVGDAGFKRSGNPGVRSRASRVIVDGSLVFAVYAKQVKVVFGADGMEFPCCFWTVFPSSLFTFDRLVGDV